MRLLAHLFNKLPDKFQAILLIGAGLFLTYVLVNWFISSISVGITGNDIVKLIPLLLVIIFLLWVGIAILKMENRDTEEEEENRDTEEEE